MNLDWWWSVRDDSLELVKNIGIWLVGEKLKKKVQLASSRIFQAEL